jgi:predicted lipid-binding transport protein (Tim44 family)
MNNFFPFLDIIILGLLAIFLGFRLKGLLGDRSGFSEDLHRDETLKPNNKNNNNVIKLDQKKISGEGLDILISADPSFNEKEFLQGAETAFKIIIKAFANSDLEKLKPLLDYDLFNGFTKSISEREARQETQYLDMLSIKKIEILKVAVDENIVSITLKIISEQTKYIIDKNNTMIEGNKDHYETIRDKWVFERDISSSNPNWKLAETDIFED